MTHENYNKIVLPTPDVLFTRGASSFTPITKEGRTLVLVPRSYIDALFNSSKFKVLVSEHEEIVELADHCRTEILDYINAHKLQYGKVTKINDSLDIEILNSTETDLEKLVTSIESQIRGRYKGKVVDTKVEQSLLQIQSVLKTTQAKLRLLGRYSSTHHYKNIGAQIADRFKVEFDNLSSPELVQELKQAIRYQPENSADFGSDVLRYLPLERYEAITKLSPIPNQFLILKEVEGSSTLYTAFRTKYSSERLEMIDLKDTEKEIEDIWKPGSELHLYQKLALDILLDKEVKVIYLIGGKQTGKTSLAMAAFESQILGIGVNREKRKAAIERQITIINSGISSKIIDQGSLLNQYTAFRRTFAQQELLIPFEEMLRTSHQRPGDYKSGVPVKGEKKLSNVHLPQIAPFVLLGPGEEQGMSFPDFVIRDESQNEYPHTMAGFLARRGINARIAVMGDLYKQITRVGLDAHWNGLLLSVAEHIGQPYCGGIVLTHSWSAG